MTVSGAPAACSHTPYGPFFELEEARRFDAHLHTSNFGQSRVWESYAYIALPGEERYGKEDPMYGPPGTYLLQYSGPGKRSAPLGAGRCLRIYLFVNPSLGIAMGTLGMIGEQGIEQEDALSREMTRWVINDLLHPEETTWES